MPEHIEVVAGSPYRLNKTGAQIRNAKKLLVHRFYSDLFTRNDIGLVILDTPLVEDNKWVQSIAIASKPPQVGTNCISPGWGLLYDVCDFTIILNVYLI